MDANNLPTILEKVRTFHVKAGIYEVKLYANFAFDRGNRTAILLKSLSMYMYMLETYIDTINQELDPSFVFNLSFQDIEKIVEKIKEIHNVLYLKYS